MMSSSRPNNGYLIPFNRYFNEKRESGETLIGTMIGVLLLSIMTSAFAGIFIASASATAGFKEQSSRMSLIDSYTSQAISDLRVEKKVAPADWSANTAKNGYEYNSYTNVGSKGNLAVNQWGRTVDGIVTIYTAMEKPKKTFNCDSSATPELLQANCSVSMGTAASVLAPITTGGNQGANWRSIVKVAEWTGTDRSSSTEVVYPRNTRVGVATLPSSAPIMSASENRVVKYVYKKNAVTTSSTTFSNFNVRIGDNSRIITSVPLEAGYFYGTITIPGDLRTIDMTMNGSNQQSISLSNIVFYVN